MAVTWHDDVAEDLLAPFEPLLIRTKFEVPLRLSAVKRRNYVMNAETLGIKVRDFSLTHLTSSD